MHALSRTRRCRAPLATLLALGLLAPSAQASTDSEAIQGAFSAYRKAVLTGDGAGAAGLLSASTHDYYELVRRLALHGDIDTVQGLSLMNQMQILMFRVRVPADQLEAQDSTGLISHAVSEGWIGKNSVRTLAPGPVEQTGDEAVLQTVIEGYERAPALRFVREDAAWKLDLVPTMKAGNVAFVKTAAQRGISQEEFLYTLLKQALGEELDASVWNAPRPQP